MLDWLAYPHLADACGLFTAAPSKRGNLGFHAEIWQLRAAAGLPRSMRLDPVAERASRADFVCPEPTIWFEVGCKASVFRGGGGRKHAGGGGRKGDRRR